jgi:hypothetical protein
VLLCSLFFHLGSLGPRAELATYKTAVEAAHAAQMDKVVATLEANTVAAQTESQRRQGVIDAYDATKDTRSALIAGLAHRVYVYAARPAGAGCAAVPSATTVAGGAPASAALPGSDPVIERLSGLTQAVYDACSADAKQMSAMIEIASK